MPGTLFNPYHKWLGIAPSDEPPTHYQLLGITHLEADVDVIEYNTDRQMVALRAFETGPHGALAKKIIREVSKASKCLLNPGKKKEYDQGLPSIARLPRPPAGAPAAPPLPPPELTIPPAEPPSCVIIPLRNMIRIPRIEKSWTIKRGDIVRGLRPPVCIWFTP